MLALKRRNIPLVNGDAEVVEDNNSDTKITLIYLFTKFKTLNLYQNLDRIEFATPSKKQKPLHITKCGIALMVLYRLD